MTSKAPATYAPQTVKNELGRFERDALGDWIGYAPDGRRTMLKQTLAGAQSDILDERFVCTCWPNCRHKGPN